MQKVISKPRHEIRYAQDNAPTVERARKSVFKSSPGKPAKEQTVVDAMLVAGDISQDAANAADRWFRVWQFAYNGYKEFSENHIPNTEIKHDDLSWLMTRADAVGDLYDVRKALGVCSETRLRAMLVEKLSFRKIGECMFPRVSTDLARKKIAAQCAFLLEQLSEYYRNVDRERRREKEACTPVPFQVG
ncbi:hypothetical protein [Acetobacter senegalensis]|uniref:hypothetical protein n=1 Tax=Acetobacter senegalensis TaxID=446692 RepID=UPI001EDD777B|nr:hypothetical protein [Acetobacter senegalensis]MCG4273911.1 hypothetical protein [Acetobacter senegalensis]